MHCRVRLLTCATVGLLTVSAATPAAAGERSTERWEIGISPVYAYIVLDGDSEPRGGGGVLHLSYLLSERISLRASASWTSHGLAATDARAEGTLRVFAANLGLSYAIDLLRACPKLELGAGVLHSDGPGSTGTDLGVMVGLALDYALYEWLTLGAALHYHGFLTDLTNLPVYVTLGPRLALRM